MKSNKLFNKIISVFTIALTLLVIVHSNVCYALDSVQNFKQEPISENLTPEESMLKEVRPVMPDSFTSKQPDPSLRVMGSEAKFVVHRLETQEGVQTLCIQKTVDFVGDVVYKKGKEIDDYGLQILLGLIDFNINKYKLNHIDEELPEAVETWIRQSAVWVYLAEEEAEKHPEIKPEDSKVYLSPEEIETIKTETTLFVGDNPKAVFTSYAPGQKEQSIYDLFDITDSIKYAHVVEKVEIPKYDIIRDSKTITISDDKKFFTTDLMKIGVVEVKDKIFETEYGDNLSLLIAQAPEGTKIYNEKNEELSPEKISLDQKFYFKVPVDEVTEKNKDIKMSVSFKAYNYNINEYVSDNYQKVVGFTVGNRDIKFESSIPLDYTPKVPDTSKYKNLIIALSGLLLFVSGAGIFALNAKRN